MYDALYEAWLKETESLELQKLSEDFYTEAVEYIRRIQRESRMLESKSVKAKLISEELSKAKRMVKELIALRFEKLVSRVKSEGSLSKEALTSEEKSMALRWHIEF